MLCREWTLVKHSLGVLTAEPLKCKCWTCDYCAPFRRRQLVTKGRLGQPDTFLTLTVNPAVGTSPDDRARSLADAWRKLRRRAMAHYGYKKLPFLAVFERTKAGEPHLHILLRVKWLSQSWLSDQMRDLIGAPIVDIRRVLGARQIANYIAKYVGKQPESFEHTKRYWCSQDWALPDPRDAGNEDRAGTSVEVRKMALADFILSVKFRGWQAGAVVKGVTHFVHVWGHTGAPPRPV